MLSSCTELYRVEITEPGNGDYINSVEVDVRGSVVARNGVERLEVNGVSAEVSDYGGFHGKIFLEEGADREISVLFEDGADNLIDPVDSIRVNLDPDLHEVSPYHLGMENARPEGFIR